MKTQCLPAVLVTAMMTIAIPAHAVAPDASIACGSFYTAQAVALATSPAGQAPYRWLLTSKTADRVAIDLLVYRSDAVLRYTGFFCSVLQNGALAPLTSATQPPPAGQTK